MSALSLNFPTALQSCYLAYPKAIRPANLLEDVRARLRRNGLRKGEPQCRSGGMADAADSKSVGRKAVWVRLPPAAPYFLLRFQFLSALERRSR